MVLKFLGSSFVASVLGLAVVVGTTFVRTKGNDQTNQLEARTKTFEELKVQRDSISVALDTSSSKNEELLDKSKLLREKLDEKLLYLSDLQRKTAEVEGDTAYLTLAYKKGERKQRDLTLELDRLEKSARGDLSDVTNERHNLTQQLQIAENKLDELKVQLEDRSSKIESLEKKVATESDAFTALKGSLAGVVRELDGQRQVLLGLEGEAKVLHDKWKNVEAQFNELKARVDVLIQTRDDLKKRLNLA